MTFVVGLTGGIGSGKSAVADEFARLGAGIVDTDVIAHQLTEAGGAAVPAIALTFGKELVTASGAMDRIRMRERVFGNPEERRTLEAILHPMIRQESDRRIADAREPYVIYVVPLLVESGDYRNRVDRVLVVDCPEEVQIARVRRRSGLSEEQVRAIIAAQASRTTRLAAADDLVDNSGTLGAMREQVNALHRRYLQYSSGQGD